MKAVFSFARFFRTAAAPRRFNLTAGAFVLAIALGLSGISSAARADVVANTSTQSTATGRSVTHGHVFMFAPQGPVDVTGSLYVYSNQTYVMNDAEYLAIYIDYRSGIVFNGSGTVLGFVDLS
jgi:hypothetical protein